MEVSIAVERNITGSSLEEPIEPSEIPQQPITESPAAFSNDIPPLLVEEPSNIIVQEEDPSNLDSDQGGFSDEGASESSSSHATPLRSTRGRKSKKKHREENSFREVAKGTHKTLPTMISTRSK